MEQPSLAAHDKEAVYLEERAQLYYFHRLTFKLK